MGQDNYAVVIVGKKITTFEGKLLTSKEVYSDKNFWKRFNTYYLNYINNIRKCKNLPELKTLYDRDEHICLLSGGDGLDEYYLGFEIVNTPYVEEFDSVEFAAKFLDLMYWWFRYFSEHPRVFVLNFLSV